MTLKKIKMLDNPTVTQLTDLIQKNNILFNKMVTEILKDTEAWRMNDSREFINNLMAQASIQTQSLFNAYVTLNSSVTNKQLSNNLDIWVNTLIDSTVHNLVLIFSLIDLNNDKSKMALYTTMYELLNTASTGNKPVVH